MKSCCHPNNRFFSFSAKNMKPNYYGRASTTASLICIVVLSVVVLLLIPGEASSSLQTFREHRRLQQEQVREEEGRQQQIRNGFSREAAEPRDRRLGISSASSRPGDAPACPPLLSSLSSHPLALYGPSIYNLCSEDAHNVPRPSSLPQIIALSGGGAPSIEVALRYAFAAYVTLELSELEQQEHEIDNSSIPSEMSLQFFPVDGPEGFDNFYQSHNLSSSSSSSTLMQQESLAKMEFFLLTSVPDPHYFALPNADLQTYPVAAYALVPVLNLPGLLETERAVFSQDTVISIHLGEILYWDDIRILRENQHISNTASVFTHTPITIVIRGDPCGPNLLLTESFAAHNATFSTLVTPSRAPDWCHRLSTIPGNNTLTGGILEEDGDLSMEKYVKCTNGLQMVQVTNPYFQTSRVSSQAYTFSMVPLQEAAGVVTMAGMINQANQTVQPEVDSLVFTEMERGTLLDSHFQASLLNPVGPQSWPISSYIYLAVRKNTLMTNCINRVRMMEFWVWFLAGELTQRLLPSLGLAPLPTFLQKKVVSAMLRDVKCFSSTCWGLYDPAFCSSFTSCSETATQGNTCAAAGGLAAVSLAFRKPLTLTVLGSGMASLAIQKMFTIYTSQSSKANLHLAYREMEGSLALANFLDAARDSTANNDSAGIASPMMMTVFSTYDSLTSVSRLGDIRTITLPFLTLAVTPYYHLSALNSTVTLTLSPEVLARIYLGTITRWNDAAVVALNPSLAQLLPNDPIRVITRSDASDTTEIFTRYLSAHSAEFAAKIGVVRSLNPASLSARAIVATSDDAGNAATVHFNGALGYGKFSNRNMHASVPYLTLSSSSPNSSADTSAPKVQASMQSILSCNGYLEDQLPAQSRTGVGSVLPSADKPASTLCYPILGHLGVTLQRDTASSFDNYGEGCPTAHELASFLEWIYLESAHSSLDQALVSFGAVAVPAEVRANSLLALLQARCDGVSLLAPARECEYSDMSFTLGECTASSQTQKIDFFWTDGENRLCSEGVSLHSSIKVPCDHLEYSSATGVIIIVFIALGNVLGCIVIATVVSRWKSKLIIYAQRSFCLVFTVAAMALNNVSFLYLGPVSSAVCALRPWFFNVSASLMYGVLFMKMRRVSVLFSKTAGLKKIRVTNMDVSLRTASILFVDVLLLVLWTIISRPDVTPDATPVLSGASELGTYNKVTCSSPHNEIFINLIRVWKALILIYGAYLAKMTWDVDSSFSEARHIGIAIYNSALVAILVAGFDLLPLGSANLDTMHAIACIIGSNGCLGLVMGPKLWLLHFDKSSGSGASSGVSGPLSKASNRAGAPGGLPRKNSTTRKVSVDTVAPAPSAAPTAAPAPTSPCSAANGEGGGSQSSTSGSCAPLQLQLKMPPPSLPLAVATNTTSFVASQRSSASSATQEANSVGPPSSLGHVS